MGRRKFFKNNSKLEKTLILSIMILCCVVLVLFIILISSAHDARICDNPECVRAAAHILDTVDPSVDPCEDFYDFACGTFLKNAFSLGQATTLHSLKTAMKNKLKEIVVEAVDKPTNITSKALQMQRKLYRNCINETAIQEDNDKTFLKLLDDVVGGWPVAKNYYWLEREFEWSKVMVNARRLGFFYQFYFRVGIHFGNNNTDNMIWIKPPYEKDVQSFNWNQENLELMSEIASDLGAYSVTKTSELRRTLDFAEQLNLIIQKYYNHTLVTKLQDRSRNVTIKDLDHKFIKIDWFPFLKNITGVKLKEDDMVVFDADDYFQDLYFLLQKTPRKYQANYIAWAIISSNVHYMTKKIRDKHKKIRKLGNETESNLNREDFCYTVAIELFKNVAEGEYIRKHTPLTKRTYVREIINYIKSELHHWTLQKLSWMDDDTRFLALLLLQKVDAEIGWTEVVYDVKKFDKVFGYDKIKMISDKLVDVTRTLSIHAVNEYYHQLKQTDAEEKEKYIDTPKLDINAFYLTYFNKLFLPAPILDGFIFDERRPNYMNYGSLGSIIGHEFTHGFVSDDWWTNTTIKNFKNASRCIVDEYNQYAKLRGVIMHDNSSVYEENLADFAGVNLAYTAYKKWIDNNSLEDKLPGIKYTPNQIFWIMTSTYLCHAPNLFEKDEMRKKNSVHALASYRVTGRLRNSPYFAKDFDCPVGSPMNPAQKCLIFE